MLLQRRGSGSRGGAAATLEYASADACEEALKREGGHQFIDQRLSTPKTQTWALGHAQTWDTHVARDATREQVCVRPSPETGRLDARVHRRSRCCKPSYVSVPPIFNGPVRPRLPLATGGEVRSAKPDRPSRRQVRPTTDVLYLLTKDLRAESVGRAAHGLRT